MNKQRKMGFKKANGFTLIELLVVIAIIALLVSILLPSLNKAKELARNVTCGVQQRGLGIGIQLYAEDNDGYFPKHGDQIVAEDSQWGQQIFPYVGDIAAFFCPSHKNRNSDPLTSTWSDINYYRIFGFSNACSYGYNYYYLGCETTAWGSRNVRVNQSEVMNQSETVALADSCYNELRGGWSAILVSPNNGFYSWGGLWAYTRHSAQKNGSANFLMLDGHIENCEANSEGSGLGTDFAEEKLWDLE